MPEFIKLSFVFILLYLIYLILPIYVAGLYYDIEKNKLSPKHTGDHTGLKGRMKGHFRIPWPIKDDDSRILCLVTKYNRLTKVFWWSYGIGVPLLIFLGSQLNKM